MSQRVLIVDSKACRGCRICELICSMTKVGAFNPKWSRIHVVRDEWNGLYVPVMCIQCDPPVCSAVCPSRAITRDELTGAMIVDEDKCTQCNLCVRTCPVGAIQINDKKIPYVCDLCGGKPKCLEWCPIPGVIRYGSPNLKKRRRAVELHLGSIRKTGYRPLLSKAKDARLAH